MAKYSVGLLEEELKNKVAADWFAAYDTTRIIGKVDFCVAIPATELGLFEAENALWAEAKAGVRKDISRIAEGVRVRFSEKVVEVKQIYVPKVSHFCLPQSGADLVE